MIVPRRDLLRFGLQIDVVQPTEGKVRGVDQAVIGSTMVDRTRDLTEVIVTYPADVPEVVEFFESNLPALGYSVDTSSGTDARWIIEFSSDGSTGELVLSVGGAGLTQSTLSIVTPVAG